MARTSKKKETTAATPAPAQEAPEQTAPLQEPEAPALEITPTQEPDPVPAQEAPAPVPEPTPEETEPAQEPDPVPPGERPIPYRAAVAVSLAVVHKEVGLGTADMLKAVGSLRKGTPATVTSRNGIYAQLKNGLYILEALLEVLPSE